MAPITVYLEGSAAFDADDTWAMSQAFTESCNALGVFNGDDRGREAVAVRIIELAHSGVTSADALRTRILAEMRALGVG
jgi:hypothetical protein